MGAGVLPAAIHNGTIYFLFGKENKYEDSAPGFSDFGGGTDHNESYEATATREAVEELTGFLGNQQAIRRLLRKGTLEFIHTPTDSKHTDYHMFLFSYPYDPQLPLYFNQNRAFLEKRLPTKVIRSTKIFEKAEIRWISINDLPRMRSQFRSYFRELVDQLIASKSNIYTFLTRFATTKRTTVRKRKQKRQSHRRIRAYTTT